MSSTKILFTPSGLVALTCCLVVASLFAASGAIGCYYVWAHQHVEPYKSESGHAATIAGIQGGLSILIVGESVYGLISLLSNRKGLIRWCLWLSWIVFFLGCIATAGTALLIWVFHFGVRDCTTSSSGQVTCKDLQLSFKIILTVVAAMGVGIQFYMPTVLRSVYSRFAVQQALSDKLDFESAGEDPDVVTDSPADRRPEVDV